jgi:hypothetical protein
VNHCLTCKLFDFLISCDIPLFLQPSTSLATLSAILRNSLL